MQAETSSLKPTYGYTLEKPNIGKWAFYFALTGTLGIPLCFLACRLLFGPEQMQIWWDTPKIDPLNSGPWMLTSMWMVFVGITIIIWHSCVVKGWKRTLLCIFVGFFIAWFYEFLGTNFDGGGVFGPYHYSDTLLQAHFLGVPLVVALGWETFAYPAFYLILYLLPSEQLGEDKPLSKRLLINTIIATLGGLFCVVVDFLVDPISVEQGFFIWHVNGGVFPWLGGAGEPITNFLGWWICGFTMMFFWSFILQTAPSKRHFRSKYLDIYIPLALYCTWFTLYMSVELFMQQRDDVIMFGLFGQGGMILIILVKLYLHKQGYQPNPIGRAISEEALNK